MDNKSQVITNILGSKKKKFFQIIVILTLFVLIFGVVNISLGSVNIPLDSIIRIILGKPIENAAWENIFYQFRLPKVITAIAVGVGLSVSGLQMQTLFRNPLAGPFVLGISSGATLGVAIVVMASFSFGGLMTTLGPLGNWMIVLAATIGSSLVLLLVVIASVRIKDSMTLLIIGLMFGSATGALVSVLQYFSDAENIQAFLIWTFGNLGGMTYQEMKIFIPVLFTGFIISIFLSKSLNAFQLGENYAQSLGVNIKNIRLWIIVSTSLMAGVITAFSGPIAFVGIAVPHLARLLFNTSDHKLLIPLVSLCGAIIMLISDILSQLPGSQHTLPINAVTSLFGAPIIVWLILRRKNIRTHFT